MLFSAVVSAIETPSLSSVFRLITLKSIIAQIPGIVDTGNLGQNRWIVSGDAGIGA